MGKPVTRSISASRDGPPKKACMRGSLLPLGLLLTKTFCLHLTKTLCLLLTKTLCLFLSNPHRILELRLEHHITTITQLALIALGSGVNVIQGT